MSQGFVADTPDGISAFQLVTVKHALKAEKAGMQMTRGPKLRKPWAIKLGLRPNASYDDVIAAVEAKLALLQAAATAPLVKPL